MDKGRENRMLIFAVLLLTQLKKTLPLTFGKLTTRQRGRFGESLLRSIYQNVASEKSLFNVNAKRDFGNERILPKELKGHNFNLKKYFKENFCSLQNSNKQWNSTVISNFSGIELKEDTGLILLVRNEKLNTEKGLFICN